MRDIPLTGGINRGGRGIVPNIPNDPPIVPTDNPRTISQLVRIAPRDASGRQLESIPTPAQTPSTLGGGTIPRYGTSDRPFGDSDFGTLADLYLRMFGPDQAYQSREPASVQPIPIGSSGGSTAIILIILAAAGAAAYWYYKS